MLQGKFHVFLVCWPWKVANSWQSSALFVILRRTRSVMNVHTRDVMNVPSLIIERTNQVFPTRRIMVVEEKHHFNQVFTKILTKTVERQLLLPVAGRETRFRHRRPFFVGLSWGLLVQYEAGLFRLVFPLSYWKMVSFRLSVS